MNNLVLTENQANELRLVLDYVMHTEVDFYQEELAHFGSGEGCVGWRAWNLARQLGMSNEQMDKEYTVSAADMGFIEDDDV